MKNKIFTILFFLSTILIAQSSDYTISVLTIGPGNSLNDSFGHSAIRVQTNNYDYVYNYGIYSFEDPKFYSNFIKGDLKYSLGVNHFKDFKYNYISNKRSIKEQVIVLPDEIKRKIVDRLNDNYKIGKREYNYDYLKNNCSTIIKDIIKDSLDQYNYQNSFVFKNSTKNTYRNLIYENIQKNSWGSLGIDICLGSYLDKNIDSEKNTFLPEYLFKYLNSSFYKISALDKKVKLVKKVNFINQNEIIKKSSFKIFFYSPLFIFTICCASLIFINTYFKKRKMIHFVLESTHVLTSIIGCLLVYLWLFTNHYSDFNYNLLWASPLNIILLFKFVKNKWKIAYLKLLLLSLLLIVLHIITNVQIFNISLYPIFIFLGYRYLQLIKFYSKTDDL